MNSYHVLNPDINQPNFMHIWAVKQITDVINA
jgi:hypothetical protein